MVIEQAVNVLKIEAEGILDLVDHIGPEFCLMVDAICDCNARVIISGIGKSGLVGRKITATLNSTGTRAIFLHPVEAMHGDLGMVSETDVFLALSNSGETEELTSLIPSIRALGCKIIAFTGKKNSTLAKMSDIVIDVGVKREACPLGLAPTASTTALLAMGDALAVVLLNKKHFKSSDYKKIHPGGALGQRLAGKVADLMISIQSIPMVYENRSMEEAIAVIDKFNLGAVFVVSEDMRLKGIITDGDIRRRLAQKKAVLELPVTDLMTSDPLTINPESYTFDALNLMEQKLITILPVTDHHGIVIGLLHLHDILGKGEFKFNGS